MIQLQLLVVTTVTYVAITVCGCLVSIFMGLTVADFGGYCVLFMDVMWMNGNHFIAEFGDRTACDFTTYLPVCSCIAHGAIMAIYHGYILFKALTSKNQAIVDKMWVLPWFVINVLATVAILATSIVITVGFNYTCDQLLAGQSNHHESCSVFQENMEWTNPVGDRINTTKFHQNTSVAQTSSWICTALWTTVAIISAMRLWRQWRYSVSTNGDLISSSCSSPDRTIISELSPTA